MPISSVLRNRRQWERDTTSHSCRFVRSAHTVSRSSHLKENGYQKAANVLKKHVTKVETPEEMTSLNEIYASWIKVSDIGQHPKQEPEVDSTTLKKIKDDPSTKEEDVDLKPIDNLPQMLQAANAPETLTPVSEEIVPKNERSSGPVSNGTVETLALVPADNPLGPDESSECKDNIPITQASTPNSTPPKSADNELDSEKEIALSQRPTPKDVSGTPLTQASVLTPTIVALQTPAAGQKTQGSESYSDSDTENQASVKKPVATAKSKPVVRASAQAAVVKSSSVTTLTPAERSDCDSKDVESPVEKSALTSKAGSVKAAKATPVKPSIVTPSPAKTAPKTPAAGKKVQSSDTDSSDSEEGSKKVTKKTKVKPTALDSVAVKTAEPVKSNKPDVTPSKPAESSDSDNSEDSIPLTQTPAKVIQTSAPTKTPVTPAAPRKAESSDSDTSDSEQEVTVKKVTKKTKVKPTAFDSVAVKTAEPVKSKRPDVTPSKPAESSDSDSSEDMIPPTQKVTKKTKVKPTVLDSVAVKTAEPVKCNKPDVTPSKPAESSDSDSSEDSVPQTKTPAKVIQTSGPTKTPVTPAAPRKAESSDSDASDSEQEVTVKKSVLSSKTGSVKAAKAIPVNPSGVTPSQTQTAPKTPAAGKKTQSSDSDSSDIEEAPKKVTKKTKVKPTVLDSVAVKTAEPVKCNKPDVTPSKPAESSDSDSSEDSVPQTKVTGYYYAIRILLLKSYRPQAPLRLQSLQQLPGKQSSDSDASDSEQEVTVKKSVLSSKTGSVKAAKAIPVNPSGVTPSQTQTAPKTPAAGKKTQSSDSDSSDIEEAPKKVTKKTKVKPTVLDSVAVKTAEPVKCNKPDVTPSKPAESSDSDSSEDSVPQTKTPAKVIQTSGPTKTPVTPAAPRKAESSDSDASDSEQEVTVKKTDSASVPNKAKVLSKTTPKTPATAAKRESDGSSDSEDDGTAPAIPTPCLDKAPPKDASAAKMPDSSDSNNDTEEDTSAQKEKTKTKKRYMAVVKAVAVERAEPVKSKRPDVTPSKPAESSDSDSSEDMIPPTQYPEFMPSENVDTEAPTSDEIKTTPPDSEAEGAEKEEDESTSVKPPTEVTADNRSDDPRNTGGALPEDTPPSSVPESAKEDEAPECLQTLKTDLKEPKAEEHMVTSTTTDDKSDTPEPPVEAFATAAIVRAAVEEKSNEPRIPSLASEDLEPAQVTTEPVFETVFTETPTPKNKKTKRKRRIKTPDIIPILKKMKMEKEIEAVQEYGQPPIESHDYSKMDAYPATESGSTTLVLSAKTLKKRKKKRKRSNRGPAEKDDKTQDVVPKKQKAEQNKEKNTEVVSHSKETLKAKKKKRHLPPTPESEEIETPKKKKRKVSENAAVLEYTTTVVEKKKKKKKKKRAKAEDLVKYSDISTPEKSFTKETSQNKKKKKKLKEKREKIINALKTPHKASTIPVTKTAAKDSPGKKMKLTKEKIRW
ncbi:hypothetical protein UPYG_G00115140 [Umbra pygmaea]|uniref:Uncharacterized protein n=1 Tax=Umbra pygmaea TaxID=75934 RepID=A0ABD0XNX5_UMBPY